MRMRAMRIKKIMAMLAIPAAIAAGAWAYEPPAELVEYRTEAEQGDTIWSLCAKVASDEDCMGELVYRTMQENHITDPGELQPGQMIIIHVRKLG
ncbi:LysM peptidoglycan-binding domain-containing protein [uncultured Dialister sp.]|uniref:LysM peptidoglycan-binding domain-containing protein n=1 Tax=uncultured Dialister sp. TaxID=278064 RepID=UPI00266F1F1A|nr:LysM peptidoglycan-binding domain-containing protein [uncultured Dialister sp.]